MNNLYSFLKSPTERSWSPRQGRFFSLRQRRHACRQRSFVLPVFSLLAGFVLALGLLFSPVALAREFSAYHAEVSPGEVFPDATRFEDQGDGVHLALKDGTPAGYVFLTNDVGYSGKPIKVLVGMDLEGRIIGAKVVQHHEPILLVGIPEEKLFGFVSRFIGRNPMAESRDGGGTAAVDAISGATVTAIVIQDGITRAARRVLRAHASSGGQEPIRETVTLAPPPYQARDWMTLMGEGSIRRLTLLNSEVNDAFAKMGVGSGEPYLKPGDPTATFIDLHAALVTPEILGRNLLGDAEYENMRQWLQPDQQAILVMANGEYSFRGSGFVRGAIFDRIKLVQDGDSTLFRDRHYRRMRALAPGMPDFAEIALFRLPREANFDPIRPWQLDLLALRPVGPIEKAFAHFTLDYALPEAFLHREIPPASPATSQVSAAQTGADDPSSPPLWERIWRQRLPDLIILGTALMVLTLVFFFQEIVIRYPVGTERLRIAFWVFTLVWLGGYAQAQLSVVNVFTFLHAFMTGFRWDFFLLEPLIFVLWSATAISMLFWGRGAFCGWLCPFGALQSLLNLLARKVGIVQFSLPFIWNERLWAIKYILFLVLLGVSFHSMATAEYLAEVEPFKTVMLLHFQREWPFVLWAVLLLVAGIFMERFFCRYLCPLGAAIAIPGRMRLFEWLKRRKQCGFECGICARECMTQAIHRNGAINPNECHYCLHCQVNYLDKTVCPPLVARRIHRGKRGGPSAAGNTPHP
ncbi:MAG: regulatory protein NosR [Magnetococcales bacterium]|nr:regulatory protein NosR [Magnetococcales bacterium]